MKKFDRSANESGFLSVEYMVAVGFSLLFLVMMTNFVVIQYGRSVVRASVDEASRAGARIATDPVKYCDDRARTVIENISTLTSTYDIQCEVVGAQMQAKATATFDTWLPGLPSYTEEATAVSRREFGGT